VGVHADILTMAVSKIQALALAGITSNVVARKLPSTEEEIDTLPMVCVVPLEEDQPFRRASFENQAEWTVPVEMVVVNKGKRLLAATGNADVKDDLYTQTGWQEKVAKAFYDSQSLGITGLWQTEIAPGKPVDRGKFNANYDYIPVTVRFKVFTQGTN